MNDTELDAKDINQIIKKVLEEIGSSREQVFQIVDSIRADQENVMLELSKTIEDIHKIIREVDILGKQDKVIRAKLAEVSSNFNRYTEDDIKTAYEEAAHSKILFITKLNEEKSLKERRYNLELSLKRILKNIEAGEKIINQISIALGYLEGSILSGIEAADKNFQMLLGIKILEAQENERKRIARDIHDSTAQQMASIVMKVDICKMMLHRNLEEGIKELDSLRNSAKEALKEVRSIIFDLKPASLEDLGLIQSIKDMIDDITKDSNLHINLKLKPINNEVEPIIQVAIYRITQEIFNNIKKHSKANHVEIKLDFGVEYLTLVISDDGIGFDVEKTLSRVKSKGTSYGLIGMFDRVKQLQGEIKINSSETTSTTYYIKLPINREVIKNEQRKD